MDDLEKKKCEKENAIEKWHNVASYIWDKLEEEWPYFDRNEIEPLDITFGIWKNIKIQSSPEELDKEKFISIVEKYIDSHRDLTVDVLLNEVEVAEEIGWLGDFDHTVSLLWDVKCNTVSIKLITRSIFKYQPNYFLEPLHKRYGYENKIAELISFFSENVEHLDYLELRKPIVDEFLSFSNKREGEFNKKVLEAKAILKRIVNDMFVKNGTLKKEVFLWGRNRE